MAGRLAWCNSACFKRLGRTFLYPIFAQQRAKTCAFAEGSSLATALSWWWAALEASTCELRPWDVSDQTMGRLFVDARSTPPRVAAVLFMDRRIEYSDMAPSSEVSGRVPPPSFQLRVHFPDGDR